MSSLVAGIAVFLAPRREHLCGISDIPATADRISEPGPVVKRPVKRELKDRASLPRLDVRPVVAHAARVVSEVEFLEEVEGLGGHLPCGRAVPPRIGSARLAQRGKAPARSRRAVGCASTCPYADGGSRDGLPRHQRRAGQESDSGTSPPRTHKIPLPPIKKVLVSPSRSRSLVASRATFGRFAAC